MKKVIVIGAGAAGMMAAAQAASQGAETILLEKMPRVGKKMLITGKGRCNLTNSADTAELIRNMTGNGSFLYSAIHAFTNEDVMAFFRDLGVPTKVERGGRVFPESDKAADAVGAMVRALHRLNVKIVVNSAVRHILADGGAVSGVMADSGEILADAVILATGGASYPGTGSTGDGYKMAERLGHTIVPIRPSLVPLEVEEDWVSEAQGLSLRNVKAAVFSDGKKVGEAFGEMLFTHFGVSGPIVLSLSRVAAKELRLGKAVELTIDLKPALTNEVLDKRVQRDFEALSRKKVKNALERLLPAKLIGAVADLAYLDAEKPIHEVTRAERLRLIDTVKRLALTVTKTRPIAEAIVTAGGVHTKEIWPKTMASKLVRGLYFAGEVIDVDGFTGGFNLQAAFSTGFVAGQYAALDE